MLSFVSGNTLMRTIVIFVLSTAALCAQGLGGPASPNYQRYQPTYDDVKSALGLTDDQLNTLKKLQQDKMTATQAFYSKMADKQKELNGLLESNSKDAAKVGELMLELQTLRKQPPPAGTDSHEKAVEVLNADQKQKLKKIEEAQKLRGAVDQALQLALINPPPAPATAGKPGAPGGMMHPMGAPVQK
jgi:Spy/CpxP family protein refolding chaperone